MSNVLCARSFTSRLRVAAALLTAACAAFAQSKVPFFEVDLDPSRGDDRSVRVRYRLPSRATSSVFALPAAWAGNDTFRQAITSVTVDQKSVASGVSSFEVPASNVPRQVTYEVRSTHYDEAANFIDPMHGRDWWFGFGRALLGTIGNRTGALGPTPVGFRFVSNVLPDVYGRNAEAAGADIRDSFFLIGDVDAIAVSEAKDIGLQVAYPRIATFDLGGFSDYVMRVSRKLRAEMRTPPATHVISITPYRTRRSGSTFQGTSFQGGMALQTSGVDPREFRWQIAHELVHGWVPLRVGGFDRSRPSTDQYWFSEGFADYLSRNLMLRTGDASAGEVAEEWNAVLRSYGTSPLKALGSADLRERYWSDPEAGKIPYWRGSLLALRWNALLRRRTRGQVGLVEVVKSLPGRNEPDAIRRFTAAMATHGVDVQPDIRNVVKEGGTIDFGGPMLGKCGSVRDVLAPAFERGFTAEDGGGSGWVARKVVRNSNAFEAGMRDGMMIKRLIEGEPGNPSRPYVFEVEDGDRVRILRYYPAARQQVHTMQIELRSGPQSIEAVNACVAWL